MNYTSEQICELVTSAKSCSYFARHYVIKKPLHDDQLTWLEKTGDYLLLNGGRASGRTTAMIARALWMLTFGSGKTTLYLSAKENMVRDAHRMFHQAYDELPDFMRPVLHRINRDGFESECGSVVRFRCASRNAVRGFGCSLIMVDNASHIDEHERAELHMTIAPVASTGATYLVAW